MRVTALLTCHNRKEKTVECLAALFGGRRPDDIDLDAVLVDDGSSDGTAEAVLERFPRVKIERGDGSLFWNRGMHRAQEIAAREQPEFLLWLNDDTVLESEALANLISTHGDATREHGEDVAVVGATVDGATGILTYGGLCSVSRLRRFNYSKIQLGAGVQRCDAMNGNIVLLPKSIYERVGLLDPVFEHALGDIDYGLRIRAAGFPILVAPGYQGTCSANTAHGTHLDRLLPAKLRWKKFVSRKGLPPRSWKQFSKRHAGWAWPMYYLYPYANFVLRLITQRISGRLRRAA